MRDYGPPIRVGHFGEREAEIVSVRGEQGRHGYELRLVVDLTSPPERYDLIWEWRRDGGGVYERLFREFGRYVRVPV